MKIGYARCSTDKQDLTAQTQALLDLGVKAERIYTDHGFTGRNKARPGLNQALAAVRTGDTLVVSKLDRLARSVPDARQIGDTLAANVVLPKVSRHQTPARRHRPRPHRPNGQTLLQHPSHLRRRSEAEGLFVVVQLSGVPYRNDLDPTVGK